MTAFQCQICFEQCANRLLLPRLATLNGDVLRAADCGHLVCQSCMAAWVSAKVEDMHVFGIFCPMESCKTELFEQDVQTLVKAGALGSQIAERLAHLRKQDYTSRLSHIYNDVCSNEHLLSMRLCPRCTVIIEKKAGCNDFGCICGHRFNFAAAPRIKDIDFECVKALTSKYRMSQIDAVKRVITAITTKGIRNYRRVMTHAQNRLIAVDLAELHEQALLGQKAAITQLRDARCARNDTKKQHLLVTGLRMSAEEARAVLEEARAGNDAAWAKIRLSRQLRANEQQDLA